MCILMCLCIWYILVRILLPFIVHVFAIYSQDYAGKERLEPSPVASGFFHCCI